MAASFFLGQFSLEKKFPTLVLAEQSPSGDTLRHAVTAPLRSLRDAGENAMVGRAKSACACACACWSVSFCAMLSVRTHT